MALILLPRGVQAQSASSFDEVGSFHVQNFAPEDYGAHVQTWTVVQDDRGFIYVGNGSGVLEYEGASWRLIPISNRSIARSLAVDSEGRVFVGAVGEFGYLAPDSLGRMSYVSLLEHVPKEDRNFFDVWKTYSLPEGVYFQTADRLFRWKGGQMKVWRPQTRFHMGHVVRDTFYMVTTKGEMLYMARDDTLRRAPVGATFAGQRIFALVPHGTDAYLAMTQNRGIFRCHGSAPAEEVCTHFNPGLTDLLTKLQPYHATVLPDGNVAIGTLRGGVLLLDRAGRLLRTLDEASGLRGQMVWYTYVDRQDGLWLGLNNGLARVGVAAPVTYYDKTTGLAGAVNSVARHRGRLYAATHLGVYVLESKVGDAAPRFVAVPGVAGQCWSLLSTRQGMLAGCLKGVYNLDERRLIWPFSGQVFTLYRSRRDPTQLYLGLQDGLARLELRAGAWRDAERIDGVRAQVRSIVEDAQGRLWLGTMNKGVLRLEVTTATANEPEITWFGVEDGLPPGWIHARAVAGRVTFLSNNEDGLFRLGSQNGSRQGHPRQTGSVSFVPDTTFDAFLSQGSRGIDELAEDAQGRVWVVAGEVSGVALPQANGAYTFAPTALRRVPNLIAYGMVAETGGPVWVGGPSGLIRLDTESFPDPSTDYPVWIRRVTSSGDRPTELAPEGGRTIEWPYQNNALRFTFAAPRYDSPERTHYRNRLDGFDDDWSAWSTETDKDYTNLWEGRYVFRAQARDVYGIVSREDTFAFRILPPWYRTWWACALYGLAFAAVVLVYVRSHRQELRRERGAAARERAMNAQLRKVDRLKDEFLANTSHELRTPLYGITGLAESLIDGATGELPEETKANLALLVQSGRRLTALVNNILDFSKLRHHSLELDLKPVDLHALVDVVLALSRPLVGSKELELRNGVKSDLPAAEADENRLQQILHNLIGNAVKFTESGVVKISAAKRENRLVLSVHDTGIGISREQQERIFEAFVQVDASTEREFGGTGLGLAVTRRLIDLHGGTLRVESALGEGSKFFFDLPISDKRPRDTAVSSDRLARAPVVEAAPEDPPTGLTDNAQAATGDAASAPLREDGPSLLVVDDEPVIRHIVSNQLAAQGFRVTPAASGAEALRLFDEHSIDLVILDVMMPRMSGFEVCRELRRRYPLENLPVIFLTAKNQAEDLVVGLAAGANDYLLKPVLKSELLARVRTHIELLLVHRQLAGLVTERTSQLAERERLLAERERLISELESRNAELARFNYTVAHDLKNPLTTIRNFIGMLEMHAEKGDHDRLRSDLRRVDKAASQLHQLIDQLHEFSRIGQLAMPCEEVALGELVRQAVAELDALATERGIKVEVADLPMVCIDRARLLEALRYLLANAVQYLGDQPTPRIEVGMRGERTADREDLIFYVRDNGLGIDFKYHDKIFELFERLDPGASEGTGVGLALVKRIIEVHGGRVWVESEGAGHGSTFCFTLSQSTDGKGDR